MRKKVLALALVLAMAAGLTAYAAPEDEADAATEEAQATEETQAPEETEAPKEGLGEKIAEDLTGDIVDLAISEAEANGDLTDNSDSDLDYILSKESFIVGVTEFQPLDYKDENGNWVGFDAEMAGLFSQMLGVQLQFVEIDWENRVSELNAKNIDCVWNGMTLTDEAKEDMSCTNPYMNNELVVVVNADKADECQDTDSLSALSIAVEKESTAQAALDALELSYTTVDTQADALYVLEGGQIDAAVVDSIMAGALLGEGKRYPDLVSTISLGSEQYAIGFRKDSDMADSLNQFLSDDYGDGTMQGVAQKYGVEAALVEQGSFSGQ